MWKRTAMCLVLALVGWTGCQSRQEPKPDGDSQGIGNTDPGDVEESGQAALRRFESEEELEAYFKGQIVAQNDQFTGRSEGEGGLGGLPPAEESADATGAPESPGASTADQNGAADGATPAPGDEDHSGTTIQEEGVDEADVVKTDGEYLYIVSGGMLRIVQARPAESMALVGSFELQGWGSELYLVGDRAVAVTQADGGYRILTDGGVAVGGAEGSAAADETVSSDAAEKQDAGSTDGATEPDVVIDAPIYDYWRPQTVVAVIDLTDRSNPTLVSKTTFDGSPAASRMIDGVLRLVLANYPNYYYDVLPLGAAGMEQNVESVDVDALLPNFVTESSDGETAEGNIVEWDGFYRPTDPDGFGVTTVVTLDSAAPQTFNAVAVVANPGLVYASTEALYLTDTSYYYDFARTETDVYKFAFEPTTVSLVGAGTVPGRILNQYSMGEFEGFLRVATTTDGLFLWETGQSIPSRNGVYVLGENAGRLDVVGQIEDIGVEETIQSARFLGDRGYVVTFRQIDPLFTLDLSDPTAPRVVGELKVPGYSTFITPMDADHVLTVGVDVDESGIGSNGVQLSIFDVSDFANPVQAHKVVIGDWSTYSEATWNPKAFTYFAEQDLLALPIDQYDWSSDGWIEPLPAEGDESVGEGAASGGEAEDGAGSGSEPGSAGTDGVAPDEPLPPPPPPPNDFHGLYVYRVTADEGFDELGRISTAPQEPSAWWWGPSFTRGVFIGDHVYAATDWSVTSAALADVSTVVSQVDLPDPYGDVVPDEPVEPTDPAEPVEPTEPEVPPSDADGGAGSSGTSGGGGVE